MRRAMKGIGVTSCFALAERWRIRFSSDRWIVQLYLYRVLERHVFSTTTTMTTRMFFNALYNFPYHIYVLSTYISTNDASQRSFVNDPFGYHGMSLAILILFIFFYLGLYLNDSSPSLPLSLSTRAQSDPCSFFVTPFVRSTCLTIT